MDSFEKHLQLYRQEHSALGCKLTHMFGIPIIVVSLPMLICNWQLGLAMFVMGWILQFVGHYFFQKNRPVFLQARGDPWIYAVGLVFVSEEWSKLLTGKRLVEPEEPTGAAKL
jgi:uncharacterized membrane protein YGL010W